jgi:hypothetical protein
VQMLTEGSREMQSSTWVSVVCVVANTLATLGVILSGKYVSCFPIYFKKDLELREKEGGRKESKRNRTPYVVEGGLSAECLDKFKIPGRACCDHLCSRPAYLDQYVSNLHGQFDLVDGWRDGKNLHLRELNCQCPGCRASAID